jgi:predicted Zn-dependent protease
VSDALDLAGRALAYAAAASKEAEVSVHSERSGLARFAGSTQHQPTLVDDTNVTVRAVRDGRVGVAVTNRTSDDGLREVAARAADAAGLVRADPDFPGLPDAAPPASADGYDEETAALGPAEQARLAAAAIAATGDTSAYGFFTSGTTELAVVSTIGL